MREASPLFDRVTSWGLFWSVWSSDQEQGTLHRSIECCAIQEDARSFTRARIIWRPKHNSRDPTCSPNTSVPDGQSNYPYPHYFQLAFLSFQKKPKTILLHPLNSTNPHWNSLLHHLIFAILYLSQIFEVFIPNSPYHSSRIRSALHHTSPKLLDHSQFHPQIFNRFLSW